MHGLACCGPHGWCGRPSRAFKATRMRTEHFEQSAQIGHRPGHQVALPTREEREHVAWRFAAVAHDSAQQRPVSVFLRTEEHGMPAAFRKASALRGVSKRCVEVAELVDQAELPCRAAVPYSSLSQL